MFVTKATLLLVVAAVAAAARPTSLDQLKGYSFEQFVQDFKLQYSDSEINQRRDLFNAELARVIAHNSQNLGWKMGINKFTAMTEKEKKAFMGWSKGVARSHKPQHLKALPSDFSIRPLSELPEKVDWRDEGMPSWFISTCSLGLAKNLFLCRRTISSSHSYYLIIVGNSCLCAHRIF